MSLSLLNTMHNRIDLVHIPYTDRGSRLLMFQRDNQLFVRLVERWASWEEEVGHYRQRPPIIEHFTIVDESGTAQPFEADTYPHVVQLTTPVGWFKWTFLDAETLLVRLPAGRFGFVFNAHVDTAQTDRRGGVLRGKRRIAYTTNARILANETVELPQAQIQVKLQVEAQDGDALLLNVTPRLGFNRSIPDPDKVIAESRARWEAWYEAVPPVLDVYYPQYAYAWWIMRAGLLNQRYYFTREALLPSKMHYVGVWHWDQFFHALAYRHVDMRLAEDQIRIVLDHQRPDGMLPDAVHDEGIVTHLSQPVDADVTKPPLAAWTVLKLYEKSGHLDFLQEVYESLVRWHNWWMTFNCDETGLCMYRHPFSSGLDDSPLWDGGMPVAAPDLNTYLCLQMESLARIAELIGSAEDAGIYRASADRQARLMQDVLWSESQGLFVAQRGGKALPTLTPFSLMPLWTGRLPGPMVERLVKHLTNPQTFWVQWPLPSVAVNDPNFDPMQMWRGPTWLNINYLFVEALERVGRADVAAALRRKSLELVMRHPDIYEYYNPITGERPPKAAPIFGWTSAVFIDLAIQETQAALREGNHRLQSAAS